MENASKALIIAASVLVAILIVAMGVRIFNQAQNSADTTSLDATEINIFNSKFERYSGNQIGSQVKSLISFAISNASTNKDDPSKLPDVYIGQNGQQLNNPAKGGSDDYISVLSSIRNVVVSTHTYEVVIGYANTGLINKITINY